MTSIDAEIIAIIKDFVWAPILGLVAWAWNRNEKEHDSLWEKAEKLENGMLTASSGLNDRIMDHIETQIGEVKTEHRRRSDKMNEHITKLFENAEKDRAGFRDALASHSRESQQRHIELLSAIHTGLAGKADK